MTDIIEPDCPTCHVCGRLMSEVHRRLPPKMGKPARVYAYQWICAQSDGSGKGHTLSIFARCEGV